MKKILILTLIAGVSQISVAQHSASKIPANLRNIKATYVRGASDLPFVITEPNPYVQAGGNKALWEEQIGETVYDLQTNQAVRPQIVLFSDNTVAGAWTYGTTPPSYTNRGTGYNYNNGSSWGAYPTSRIESVRTGWGNPASLGAGEIVVSHNSTTGLTICSRPLKGTGPWTSSTLTGPLNSGGTTALLWPRMITSGNTVHIIACTDQAPSPSVYYYQGLALALVYIRSTNGGLTWDAPIILPGMDSASIVTINNKGFSGDAYNWAAPKGDTIAFVYGDSWSDVFLMKSLDGGTSWTKTIVFDFPDLTGIPAPTPIISSNDGSVACALDASCNAHVVFGFMRVSDDNYLDADGATSYYPYSDGLVYWNETMPTFDTVDVQDSNNYIATMYDFNSNGISDFPIVGNGEYPFGIFYLALTSMPQIIIDDLGNIFVTYSSLREDLTNMGANPNEQLYRHLFAIMSDDGGLSWSLSNFDLTSGIVHEFDECVFGSLAARSNSNLYILYQADEEPGLAIRGDLDVPTTNRIYCLNITKSDLGNVITEITKDNPVSTQVFLYPNPVRDYANINLVLSGQRFVTITIGGF